MNLFKKWWFWLIVIIVIIILVLMELGVYNSIAEKQRESIKYCDIDEDCVLKPYASNPCMVNYGCFNKNGIPFGDSPSGNQACDRAMVGCECIDNRCVSKPY